MVNRISRAALILGVTVLAGMPTIGIAYTLSGYKWAIRQVPYYINPANGDVTAAAAITALQKGADAWSMQTSADFSFYYMGQTAGSSVTRNAKNEVFFRNTNPGLTGEAYRYYDSTGKIVEFDIVLYDAENQWFTGSSGCASGYYIEDTAAHEFGHGLGLKHSNVESATMWPTATRCGTWKRSLEADDIAGVEKMYPASGSNTAPTVSIGSPANNASVAEGTSVSFIGSASDKEDGNLSSKLVWTSSRDGQIGTGSSFSRVLSVGTHTISAKATDSAGYTAVSKVSAIVSSTTTNSAPSVTIGAPSSNLTIPFGTAVTFSGSATDAEDGSLTSKLVWTSNLEGPLGIGGRFSKALTVGTHTVRATVSDSDGASTAKQVTVYVIAPSPPPGLTLSVSAAKKKGLQYANLKWSGATSTKVDIYRDGVRVANTANDGAHTDAINQRGGASYTYKLCEAGTTTCSSGVVVRF